MRLLEGGSGLDRGSGWDTDTMWHVALEFCKSFVPPAAVSDRKELAWFYKTAYNIAGKAANVLDDSGLVATFFELAVEVSAFFGRITRRTKDLSTTVHEPLRFTWGNKRLRPVSYVASSPCDICECDSERCLALSL